jgi:hypothetical protein
VDPADEGRVRISFDATLGQTEHWRQFFAGYPRLEAKFQGRRLIIKGVSDEEDAAADGAAADPEFVQVPEPADGGSKPTV